MPENSATAMVQTPDGYLWFGTFNGLVRFDGVEFKVFDPSNTPALLTPEVLNLHLDASGRLWVSTRRGVAIREGERWTAFSPGQGWTGNHVRSFSENAGVICITTFDGKVFRVEDGNLAELAAPPGDPSWPYLGHVDRQGNLWVAQSGFVGSWDGRQWRASPWSASVTNELQSAGQGRDGSFLIATKNELLRIVDGNIQSRVRLSQPVLKLWRLDEDTHGTVWATSVAHGLYGISPTGEVQQFIAKHGLTCDSLRFAFEDRENNLWVGSSGGGLMRFKRRTFVNYAVDSGFLERNVKAVAEAAPGLLWVGTFGGGLARFENHRAQPVMTPTGELVAPYLHSILVDRHGRTWAGAFRGGLFVSNDDGWSNVAAAELASGSILGLFEDSQNRIWVGGSQQTLIFSGTDGATESPVARFQLGGVRCFAENPVDRSIWAINSDGLFRLAPDDQWQEIKGLSGTSVVNSLCLHFEPDGTLWVGRAKAGLERLRGGQWAAVTEAHGLPSATISFVLEDDSGFWWLASNRGVIRAARRDIEDVADGRLSTLPLQVFNGSDGMASAECTSGAQNTALKDSLGRLWFATIKGLAMVDPAQLRLNTNPPPVVIARITYRDRSGQLQRAAWHGEAALELPAGTHEVGFHWTGLSFVAPEKMRYAYRLGDNAVPWVDVGSQRSLNWYTPAPTRLRLQVKAATNDGFWNENGAEVTVIVHPFVWQTTWFRVLALSVAMGSACWIVWWTARTRLHRRVEEHDRDIGERKRVEATLKAGVEQLRRLLDTLPAAAYTCDPRGLITYFNKQAELLWGCAPRLNHADSRFCGSLKMFTKDGAALPHEESFMALALEQGRSITGAEVILERPDGTRRTVLACASPLLDGSGNLVGAVNVVTDITERDQAAERIREQLEELQRWHLVTLDREERHRQFKREVNELCSLLGQPARYSSEAGSDLTPAETRLAHAQRFDLGGDTPVPQPFPETAVPNGMAAPQQRAETGLTESENRFRTMCDASPLGIFLTDMHGACLYTNQQYQALTGLSFAQALGQGWTAPIHPEDLDQVVHRWEEAVRFGTTYQAVQRACHQDGRVVWYNVKAAPIREQGGACTGYVGTLEDITERKRAEEDMRELLFEAGRARGVLLSLLEDQKQSQDALRASEERFRTLIENASDMITVLNGQGIIRFQSPSSERILGFPLSDMIGRNVLDFVHPEDATVALRALQQATASNAIPSMHRLRLRHRDGSWRHVETIGRNVPTEAPDGYVVVNTRDISAQVQAEAERQELEIQLRQTQKLEALGTLAGGIAHDFNNILGAIICFTELAKMDSPADTKLKEYHKQILEACTRATNLVRQILSFSRRQTPERCSVQLAPIVTEALELLRSTLPATIQIHSQVEPDLPKAMVDATQIHQILMNLCTNAAHAMRGKQGQMTVELSSFRIEAGAPSPHSELSPQKNYLRLIVKDTGHGMDEQVLQRLFEPFFSTKEPGEGTGLGLAVVHGIIRDHGGVITVASQPGVGSCFTVYLPATRSEIPPEPKKQPRSPKGHGERILFVDDELPLCEASHSILRRLGYEPVVFQNPDQAWQAVQNKPDEFAAVVTDLTMPGMTGLELAEKIQSLRPQTPVILASGFMGGLTEESIRGAGFRVLVHKPLSFDVLATTVGDALRHRGQPA